MTQSKGRLAGAVAIGTGRARGNGGGEADSGLHHATDGLRNKDDHTAL